MTDHRDNNTQVNRHDRCPARILLLAAHPEDIAPPLDAANVAGTATARAAFLALDEEARTIQRELDEARFRDSVEFSTEWAVRPRDLQNALATHQPHIVHFSAHGGSQGIALVGEDGAAKPVSGEALASMFRCAAADVRLVVFNACSSEGLVRKVTRHVDLAIGMRERVADDASRIFARRLYRALADGCSVRQAFNESVVELALAGHPDRDRPILLAGKGSDPARVVFAGPEATPPFGRPRKIEPGRSESPVVTSAPEPHPKAWRDVLLVCAMKDEYDQVLEVTGGIQRPGWSETAGPSGWTVADADFAASDGGLLRIRATWTTYMGRESAQSVASRLLAAQPVRCLAMSGICAGRRGEVSLGDVIFGDRLWSYDAGKRVVEDGREIFRSDPIQYRPPEVWIQAMQKLELPRDAPWLAERPGLPLEHQEDWILLQLERGDDPRKSPEYRSACPDWKHALPRLWQRGWVADRALTLTERGRDQAHMLALLDAHDRHKPTAFRSLVAPLATGAAVIEDSGIFLRLANSVRKVLGVDMEASALGALGAGNDIPVVVAKGVSDFGDPFKDDRYRTFAARAAAECLIALLRQAAHLLRP